jgi:pimeloyl-ACP methyl ester carboxylesterase
MDADLLRIPAGPGSMHVERYGHGGSPILLVHGFGTCSFLWREVGPELAMANRTAFAVDLLGHGESDRPFDADFGIAAQSDYLDRALTALRLQRATVVGVDLGAVIALHLAATRPDRVDRVVLVNPLMPDEVPGPDIRALQRNTARFALRLSRGVMGAAPLLGQLLRNSVARPEHMPDQLVARYLAPYVGRDGVEHLLALARSVRALDMQDIAIEALPQPTLVIHGELDRFVTSRQAERLASTLPGGRLQKLPAVGRLVPEEAPEALAQMILEFVGAATLV